MNLDSITVAKRNICFSVGEEQITIHLMINSYLRTRYVDYTYFLVDMYYGTINKSRELWFHVLIIFFCLHTVCVKYPSGKILFYERHHFNNFL